MAFPLKRATEMFAKMKKVFRVKKRLRSEKPIVYTFEAVKFRRNLLGVGVGGLGYSR